MYPSIYHTEILLFRALRLSLLGRLMHRRSLIRWEPLVASLGLKGISIVILTEKGVKIHCN